jgi:hypothetical protein
MLIEATQQITRISDKNDINSQNYFEAINFIDNLYTVINKLKLVISTKDIVFMPTFKGRYTCEKFGIVSEERENEMKYFVIESKLFLEDTKEKEKKLIEVIGPLCKDLSLKDDILTITLL